MYYNRRRSYLSIVDVEVSFGIRLVSYAIDITFLVCIFFLLAEFHAQEIHILIVTWEFLLGFEQNNVLFAQPQETVITFQ